MGLRRRCTLLQNISDFQKELVHSDAFLRTVFKLKDALVSIKSETFVSSSRRVRSRTLGDASPFSCVYTYAPFLVFTFMLEASRMSICLFSALSYIIQAPLLCFTVHSAVQQCHDKTTCDSNSTCRRCCLLTSCQPIVLSANWFVSKTSMKP